ncbi:MAG: hypothetical protein EXQ87_05335 [Alphaproteobacteria bacterium]|nr:hypothetical protein [Alphaproteobacteria bacterium]
MQGAGALLSGRPDRGAANQGARGCGAPVEDYAGGPRGARRPADIPAAYDRAAETGAQALLTTAEAIFSVEHARVLELALKLRLPVAYPFSARVRAGGLISYGADIDDIYRRAASYVDRILKGAKPGDLPVQQPTKFELFVNMKTAKALGINIPESIFVRADELIE